MLTAFATVWPVNISRFVIANKTYAFKSELKVYETNLFFVAINR